VRSCSQAGRYPRSHHTKYYRAGSRVRFFGSVFRTRRPSADESARHRCIHWAREFLGYATNCCFRFSGNPVRTRISSRSAIFMRFMCWMWLYTRIAFRKEKIPRNKKEQRSLHLLRHRFCSAKISFWSPKRLIVADPILQLLRPCYYHLR